MELSDECRRVVDGVKSLSLHSTPSMFWISLQERTELSPDRVCAVMWRWSINQSKPDDYEDLLTLISEALDIQTKSMYEKIGYNCWDDLCGLGAWEIICQVARVK